jgi:cellulose synthase/poly-beta-1,6-N-acetylglucosamine synthase-like glycosyltransferase
MPSVLIISLLSALLTVQGVINLYCMLYAWEDAEKSEDNKSPTEFLPPKLSFTAIVPVRHEEMVIGQTINAIAEIDYPKQLMEIVVVCRTDDPETISEVWNAEMRLKENGKSANVVLELFDDNPINKPHSLNVGLRKARGNVVVIFDAEDQPHKDIYNVVNTVMSREKVDVIQSGVQLMNFQSSWFSALNVLEYFFWFKSVLHLFSGQGIIPLGGNTVFFKKEWLVKSGGWDEKCLTEDADIGIRLSIAGAKTRVIYDEQHATREETPDTVESFVKQRTRWNQGFIQILLKGDWMKLPKLKQRLLAVYLLLMPEFQALMFLMVPVSIFSALFLKLPVATTMFTFVPMLLLVLQLITFSVGLYEFTRDYKLRYPILMPFKLMITFWFYIFLLGISSMRAMARVLGGELNWEKTKHINAHREEKVFNYDKV